MTTGRVSGRIERTLGDLRGLSPEESVLLFTRWMEGADENLIIGVFTGWMQSVQDTKLKKTLFVSWMAVEKKDPKFLKEMVVKASAVYVTEGFAGRDSSEIEGWMEAVFEKNPTLRPSKVAHMAKNKFRIPQKMLPMLKSLARAVKERIRLRRRKKTANTDETSPRRSSSATKRLLAEGTYSVNVSVDETTNIVRVKPVAQPPLPGFLDESPSLDSTRRIQDFEALIAPYRPLLAEVASLDVLDELLRLLYEQGDVPSVIVGQGKTYDGEYRKLQSHVQFLKMLQGVSLYDHSYNVLKAALEIATDDLRQRHDFLLPAIITAALAHDIGKVPSLWDASPVRKYGHESVGVAKLNELLVSHPNEAFAKSVFAAVKYHHTNKRTDTIARIVMDADAKAREYEIASADPAIIVQPMAEWLDIARLAEFMLPAINKLAVKHQKAIWNAMSFNGVVYCMPNYVWKVLISLATEKKVLDYRLVRNSYPNDNWSVLAEFASLLRRRGLLAYAIQEPYFGLKFLVQSSVPSMSQQTFLAVPIKAGLFPMLPSELDRSKTDYLKTIVSVRPSGDGD